MAGLGVGGWGPYLVPLPIAELLEHHTGVWLNGIFPLRQTPAGHAKLYAGCPKGYRLRIDTFRHDLGQGDPGSSEEGRTGGRGRGNPSQKMEKRDGMWRKGGERRRENENPPG